MNKFEMDIDKCIVNRFFPKVATYGNVFKLSYNGSCYTLETYYKVTNGNSIKEDHINAKIQGDLGYLREAQLELNYYRDMVRGVIKEELKGISKNGQ